MDRKIYTDSLLYLFGSIIVAVLGFVISLLYSYFFNPDEYGIHSLASSTYMLLSQFFGLWLSTGVLRFYEKYKNKSKLDDFNTSIYISQFIISLTFIVILNAGAFIISSNELFKKIFLIYSIIYFFEYNILVYNASIRCEMKVKRYNFNVMLNNLLKIIILLLLIYIFKINSVIVISLSILLTEFIQFIYFLIKYQLYKNYNIKKFNTNIMKELFLYAFPLIGTTITSWILNVSDRYVINILNNSYDVGLYSYAYLLGNNLFWLLSNFIMLGAYPNLVKLFEKNEMDNLKIVLKKYINFYLMIILPCCFGILAVSKTLFFAITSEKYHEAYGVFIYTGIGISILGLSQFINKVFELYKKTKIILMLNVICAIFNIIFNFLFIYKFGYIGGAVSTLLSYLLYFILSLIMSKKYLVILWDFKSITKYLFSSICMYLSILVIQRLINSNNDLICLIIYILTGMVIYAISLFIVRGLNKDNLKELIKIIKH